MPHTRNQAPVAANIVPSEDLVETVTSAVVSCDGGGGVLGHPRVFLTFNDATELRCPYCSKLYRLAGGAKLSHGH
jgi:uncharacterized Zn-finger protein